MIRAPLYEALEEYVQKNTVRFHMPGHKGRDIFPQSLQKRLMAYDVTEMPETDNLIFPEGAIKKAQELTAKASKSFKAFFLTGGSTTGNLAMITAAVGEGDKILVDRNAHLSVFSALALCGAEPVYINGGRNFFCAVPTDAVEKCISANKDAKAVFITSPNAFGMTADLAYISRLCKDRNMYLLVDEAHGAHFPFHPELPPAAVECGADAAVQSFHKTLPALTMSAVLHVGNPSLCDSMNRAIRLYHTSSPSYLVMASTDLARAYMEKHGRERIDRLIKAIRANPPDTLMDFSPGERHDILRLVFKCDGYKSAKIFEGENIAPEMCGADFVVCIVTAADEPADISRLFTAARALPPVQGAQPQSPHTKAALTPRQAYKSAFETVPAEKAVGRICKTAVYLYPPGIPVLAPGEVITREITDYINAMSLRGDVFHGLSSGMYEVTV